MKSLLNKILIKFKNCVAEMCVNISCFKNGYSYIYGNETSENRLTDIGLVEL